MNTKSYDRTSAINYAKKWALSRNPKYYNFDSVGGDCTSFVSQCLFAGSKKMNYNSENGWYYNNGYDKSPSWSGVEFLHNFLTQNKSVGPYGNEVSQDKIELGDIAQLSFDGDKFSHSLVIVKIDDKTDLNQVFISSHTFDSFNKRILEYSYEKIRFIHIKGIRKK